MVPKPISAMVESFKSPAFSPTSRSLAQSSGCSTRSSAALSRGLILSRACHGKPTQLSGLGVSKAQTGPTYS